MHLNRQTGEGAYGTSTVYLNGQTPAALSGVVAGAEFGPWWMDTNGPRIAYQNGTAGWIVQSYNTGTAALATLYANGQNAMAAGGGEWGAWLAGGPNIGVHTSVTIASPNAPMAGSFLCTVGTNGYIVLCDYQQTSTGLSVYDTSGTSVLQIPGVVLTNGKTVRLVDGYLSFQANAPYTYQGQSFPAGWHMINVDTGIIPYWFPRTDGVHWLVPFLGTDGTLYVTETTESVSVRVAARSQGYSIAASTGIGFHADGMEYGAGVARIGYCTDNGESQDSLVFYDVTMATGTTLVWTVTAGVISSAVGPTFEPTTFPVGSAEGSPLARSRIPPMIHPVVDPRVGFTATQPWKEYWQGINDNAVAAANAASGGSGGGGGGSSANGFGVIAGDLAPIVAATAPNDTLALTSDDASVTLTGNPITKTVDVAVNRSVVVGAPVGRRGESGRMGVPGPTGPTGATGAAGPMGPPPRRSEDVTRVVLVPNDSGFTGSYLVPLALGSEPLTFVSDGAGQAIFVWYTP